MNGILPYKKNLSKYYTKGGIEIKTTVNTWKHSSLP